MSAKMAVAKRSARGSSGLSSRRSAGAAPGARRSRKPAAPAAFGLSPEDRHELIARAAYLRAERRGFAAGCELQDWLEAEAEIDAALSTLVEPSTAAAERHD